MLVTTDECQDKFVEWLHAQAQHGQEAVRPDVCEKTLTKICLATHIANKVLVPAKVAPEKVQEWLRVAVFENKFDFFSTRRWPNFHQRQARAFR